MENLEKLSKISEINREQAAQIMGIIFHYKKKNNVERGNNEVLDILEELASDLYNTVFAVNTVESAIKLENQLEVLQMISNELQRKILD